MSAPPPEQLTRGEVAQLAGLSLGRISQLCGEGVIHHDAAGRFELRPTAKALIQYYRSRGGDQSTLTQRRIELMDVALAKAKGEYLPVAELRELWGNAIIICRQKLLSLGNRIAPRLVFCKSESDMEREINGEVDQALTELVRSIGDGSGPKETAAVPISPEAAK